MSECWRRELGVRGGPIWAVGYVAFPPPVSVAWTLLVAVFAVGCGGSDSATAPPPDEQNEAPLDRTAVSIELLTDSVRPMGMLGVTFPARARGRNAAGEIIPSKQETWSTDTPEIVEVTPEGEVTSLSEGEGRVIARLDGVEAVIRVPVREVARLEWQASLGESTFATSGPAIGPDGTIYRSALLDVLGTAHQSWAFDPGGAVRWSKLTPTQYTEPAIGADGTLYVGTLDFDDGEGELVAMGPDGSILWRLARRGAIDVPVLGEDGTLFALEREIFGNTDVVLTLLAVDAATGEILWEYQPEERRTALLGALAVTPDNTVYFRTRNSVVHAVSGEGEPLWTVQLGAGGEEELMYGSLAIGADGTIYGGTKAGRLYALNPEDGSVRWSLKLGYEITSGAAIGADGTIYQALRLEGLFAISPGGEVLWQWSMNGVLPRSASIGGDGTVYLGENGVVAVRPDGTLKWDFSLEHAVSAVPAIGLDGMIYLVSQDGMLHAIRELEENNGGFDASPWPVWRGNRQNTGRAGP